MAPRPALGGVPEPISIHQHTSISTPETTMAHLADPLADRDATLAAPSLTRAAVGFIGSTFLTASLMVLVSAFAG
jgi:hypothetical protein